MLIDTHCHLDFPEFDPDRDEVIKRANKEGISYIINVGSSIQGSKGSIELSKQYDCIYATVGIHPHEADKFTKNDELTISGLLKEKKVVAVGEIGLDYYKNYSTPENQRVLFLSMSRIAKDFNLPVVVHSRQASQDTIKILKELKPVKAVVHCFSGEDAFLKECLDLGFFVSFTCNITYPAKLSDSRRDPALAVTDWRDKKADSLRELLKRVPLDRLLLETDAPFLPPQELHGRRNEPLFVKKLAQEIARIKQASFEKIAETTTANAKQFFGL